MFRKLVNQCITALTTWYDMFCTVPSSEWKGFVVCILDGKTIRVVPKGSPEKVTTVRLCGLQDPKGKKERKKAFHILKGYILPGDVVEIRPMETYSLDCVEALVIRNGVMLNMEMIRRK